MIIFVFIVSGLVCALFILMIIHSCVGGKFFCKTFGWHRPSGKQYFDSVSVHDICKDCGKDIMQDGQGNWF